MSQAQTETLNGTVDVNNRKDLSSEAICQTQESISAMKPRTTKRFKSRGEFLSEHVPGADDPDIVALQSAFWDCLDSSRETVLHRP